MNTSITKVGKRLLIIPVLFFYSFFFSSCAHMYYSPNSSNVPLFREKGEARINAYYSGGDEVEGAEFQGAMAVSNHIGIMLNTAFVGSKDGDDKGNGYLIEGGAGYFSKIGDEGGVFETYGGLGIGNASNTYYTGGSSEVGITKFFLQPSIGYTHKIVDVGFASKFSAAMLNIKSGDENNFDLLYIKDNPTSFLWEPSLFFRVGFKGVKAQFQYTRSYNLNHKDLAQEVQFFSMGLTFSIQPSKKTGNE
jgi:hypothetical protein